MTDILIALFVELWREARELNYRLVRTWDFGKATYCKNFTMFFIYLKKTTRKRKFTMPRGINNSWEDSFEEVVS